LGNGLGDATTNADVNSGGRNLAMPIDFDSARLEHMERPLQALEDTEAIRNLKARHAASCSDRVDENPEARIFNCRGEANLAA